MHTWQRAGTVVAATSRMSSRARSAEIGRDRPSSQVAPAVHLDLADLDLRRGDPDLPAVHLDLADLDLRTGDAEEPEAGEAEAEEPGPTARSVGERVAWAVAHSAEAFALFNKDGSGALDVAEVYRALELLGMVPHASVLVYPYR